MKDSKSVSQHKQMAMGTKMKSGGAVKGLPASPITTAKRDNGVPGYKKGGMIKKGGKC